MKKKTIIIAGVLLVLGVGFAANGQEDNEPTKDERDLQALVSKNKKTKENIKEIEADNREQAQKNSDEHEEVIKLVASLKPAAKSNGKDDLSKKNFSGDQEIVVNDNKPTFDGAAMSTAKGAWEAYSNLDNLNRAHTANAMLNRSLMPKTTREPLTWNPTGWHNKRTSHGWLYNRSHLIGFQLSGENNNPKNLITGTMSLNNPNMLAHEMDVAYYLKADPGHYVRYQVEPIYRGNELLPRGVHMQAKSVGDDQISFNVYIFNVEEGFQIDYNTGYTK